MKLKQWIRKNYIYIVLMGLIILFNQFILSVSIATGSSMEPTIPSPSLLLVNKWSREYNREDIIVFKTSGMRNLTKRIIGLPGDKITVTKEGIVFINNQPYIDEYGYITIPTFLDGDIDYPVTVGSDEYFVMGDNRNVSVDSRFETVGCVKKNKIIGIVINF